MHQSSTLTCRFRRSCTLPLLTVSPPHCLFHIFLPWFPSCLIISITRVTPPPHPQTWGDLINQVTPPVSTCLEFKQKRDKFFHVNHTHTSGVNCHGVGGVENPHFTPCCCGINLNVNPITAQSDVASEKCGGETNKALRQCVTERREDCHH